MAVKKRKNAKRQPIRARKSRALRIFPVGDYVVHETHGLGIYRGIEKIEREKVVKDYIKIEYGDGELLLSSLRPDWI